MYEYYSCVQEPWDGPACVCAYTSLYFSNHRSPFSQEEDRAFPFPRLFEKTVPSILAGQRLGFCLRLQTARMHESAILWKMLQRLQRRPCYSW
eukprot:COSAG05_NODE_2217_length_3376_cov_61.717410_7_plen_93_part_00